MVRPLRIEFPGALYHITSRGNAKQTIFHDDKDRRCFLDILSAVVERHNWLCYSYCLMSNHFHLLIETPKANLSKGMHQLNCVYAQKSNLRHEKAGHFLQGRYHAIIVDKEEYLLAVCRYIVLNPVRAGLVDDPALYRWSSYLDILRQRRAPKFLHTSYVLSLFAQPGRNAVDEYKAFVMEGLGEELWSKLRGNMILGGNDFALKIRPVTDTRRNCRGIARRERFAGRPELSEIFRDMDGKKDGRDRKIMTASVEYGYTHQEIAEYLGLHRTSISKIINSFTADNSHFGI